MTRKEVNAYHRRYQRSNAIKTAENRKRARDKKRLYAQQAKQVPCADCKKKYPYYVMDFDHVKGEKKFNGSRVGDASWSDIIAEIAKCEVVCANCHRKRTYKQN